MTLKIQIAAVIVEPIQCTAGDIYIAEIAKLKEIELLCKTK